MPSKIQNDENLWFLYTCLQKSDMKSIDFAAVAQTTNLKAPAARMRYTRLKRQIEDGTLIGSHGTTFSPTTECKKPASYSAKVVAQPQQKQSRTSSSSSVNSEVTCKREKERHEGLKTGNNSGGKRSRDQREEEEKQQVCGYKPSLPPRFSPPVKTMCIKGENNDHSSSSFGDVSDDDSIPLFQLRASKSSSKSPSLSLPRSSPSPQSNSWGKKDIKGIQAFREKQKSMGPPRSSPDPPWQGVTSRFGMRYPMVGGDFGGRYVSPYSRVDSRGQNIIMNAMPSSGVNAFGRPWAPGAWGLQVGRGCGEAEQ